LIGSGVTLTISSRVLLPEIGYEGIDTEEKYVACGMIFVVYLGTESLTETTFLHMFG
jgi:hypothetical protein